MRTAYKLLTILLLFSLTLSPVFARSSEEIQKEIDAKQKELNTLNQQLQKAENDKKNIAGKKASSLSEIDKVKAELEEIATQQEINTLKKQQLEEELKLKSLEKEDYEKQQDGEIVNAYIFWKTDNIAQTIFGEKDFLKKAVYHQFVTEQTRDNILGISTEIDTLSKNNEEYQNQLSELEKETVALEEKKKLLEQQVNQLDQSFAQATQNASGLRSQTKSLEQQIGGLSAEWNEAQKNFENLVGEGNNGGTQQLVSGELYVTGVEPDGFGHGIGLSQWGAYGAANKGWDWQKILTFYYANTKIEKRSGYTINVSGYGVMNLDDYAAGIGEIPDYACGNQAKMDQWKAFADAQGWSATDPKRKKYVFDNPNTPWDCWPEDAIKAQLVAARSYGITNAQPICTSTQCQVYKGGKNKAWAAFETHDRYIVSTGATGNGQIIRAFYSAYNHNGWGTADNDTIWSTKTGDGSQYSYLRAVNDSAITYHYNFKRKTWRTNSYSMADFNNMINWCVTKCTSGSWVKTNVKDKIVKIASMALIKDPSGRVKKVKLVGTNGQSVTLAGWYFRDIYNVWIYNTKPSGQLDYIQSLTFSLQNVN